MTFTFPGATGGRIRFRFGNDATGFIDPVEGTASGEAYNYWKCSDITDELKDETEIGSVSCNFDRGSSGELIYTFSLNYAWFEGRSTILPLADQVEGSKEFTVDSIPASYPFSGTFKAKVGSTISTVAVDPADGGSWSVYSSIITADPDLTNVV